MSRTKENVPTFIISIYLGVHFPQMPPQRPCRIRCLKLAYIVLFLSFFLLFYTTHSLTSPLGMHVGRKS